MKWLSLMAVIIGILAIIMFPNMPLWWRVTMVLALPVNAMTATREWLA